MPVEEAPSTVHDLLRTAAAADARAARDVLRRIDGVRLLELVVTQAELAVDDEHGRPAGIDAVGDLTRAAIEVLGLPQGAALELDDEDTGGPPTVTGWELVTVDPEQLRAATLTMTVPAWTLALVAFVDGVDADGTIDRHAVAAAADGRCVQARISMTDHLDAPQLQTAVLTQDPLALGADADLASALQASLRDAARGV
ncbi:MAG: hypothetical protein R6U94_03360 [Nitriliruptoraceae bacterium]